MPSSPARPAPTTMTSTRSVTSCLSLFVAPRQQRGGTVGLDLLHAERGAARGLCRIVDGPDAHGLPGRHPAPHGFGLALDEVDVGADAADGAGVDEVSPGGQRRRELCLEGGAGRGIRLDVSTAYAMSSSAASAVSRVMCCAGTTLEQHRERLGVERHEAHRDVADASMSRHPIRRPRARAAPLPRSRRRAGWGA